MTTSEIEKNFELMIYKKKEKEFEDFAIAIYRLEYPEIHKVKPQGQKGDGGNDGYVSGELVIQCYAPEKIEAKECIAKIERDLQRAISSNWKFKEWHFVVNDHFSGLYRDIHHKIDELKQEYPNLVIKLVDTDGLKKLLLSHKKNLFQIYCILNVDRDIVQFNDINLIINVINFIAEDNILRIFNPVVDFIDFSINKFSPDGIKKLKINVTNEIFSKIFGAYIDKSREIIEEYKDRIGLSQFEEVQKEIIDIFQEKRKRYASEEALKETHNYFFEKNPNKEQNFYNALWIVIAYFFDICDIGDNA